jgi:perosamine synthetase
MIKLAKPYIPAHTIDAVREILESGNLIQGQNVLNLEEKICTYLESPQAKMVSSGTAALHLALLALNIGPGDEVIVPAFTYPATANVVEVVGAKSVFVDINLSDFCINPNLIEEKITPRTKAIIPVHEFGQSADMDLIMGIAKKHGLYVIEDAACALGTEYNGRKAGTFGDVGCFSLHPRKAITTGEGGIVTAISEKIGEKIELLRNHGVKKENGKLDFFLAGLNYRLTDFQAAIGIPQLEQIDMLIDQRIEQANRYNELIGSSPDIITPAIIEGRKHVYQTYHVIVEGLNRDELILKLREQGVETNLGAQALHCLTYFKEKYGIAEDELPNATKAFKNGLALPIGWHLNEADQEFVSEKLLGQWI